jgi:hypothetical protein
MQLSLGFAFDLDQAIPFFPPIVLSHLGSPALVAFDGGGGRALRAIARIRGWHDRQCIILRNLYERLYRE